MRELSFFSRLWRRGQSPAFAALLCPRALPSDSGADDVGDGAKRAVLAAVRLKPSSPFALVLTRSAVAIRIAPPAPTPPSRVLAPE